jgi:serine/threonine-protein kinase
VKEAQWLRVKALFEAAVERPAGERHAFVAAAAGEDDALRGEVASLLTSDDCAGFLDRLADASEALRVGALAAPLDVLNDTLPDAALAPGHRIGPYEIVAFLGAGSMGEVYRARDTKLNRDVALKVLPGPFALDPDRLARFTREARLRATINHPNIAAIYGLEESNLSTSSGQAAAQALVLELVDGPTLARRIAERPIPLVEALGIARKLADALEAAHEKGIIHRDVKPANIMIASGGVVKVLDFGLAKVWDDTPHSSSSGSPGLTATDLGTQPFLGTPTYMSPEQARCRSLDRRTDIWSFGCVLYEMLTGRAPFAGETVSDTLAAILDREPDETLLPDDTPVQIRRLLRRCLEKVRDDRLDSVAAARDAIDDAIASPVSGQLPSRSPRRVRTRMLATLAVVTGPAVFAGWLLIPPTPVAPALSSWFPMVTAPAAPLNVSGGARDLAMSPDGRHLVYRSGGSITYGSPLMVRALDRLDGRKVTGVETAYAPFFSPNSLWIGFFDGTELKIAPVAGGPMITLCEFTGSPLGASWGDDNTITFATSSPGTGLWRVSADGGEPTVLTRLDPAQREESHAFPSVLPRGSGVLFTIATGGQADSRQVAVLDLRTGQRKVLIRGGSDARYVETGHLIYAAAGTLRAVRFDPHRLEVLGDPVTIVEDVMMKPTGAANYTVSRPGTLVYVPGQVAGAVGASEALRSFVWVDRQGNEERINLPPRAYGPARLSPTDPRRLVVGILERGNTELWIADLRGGALRQLTDASGMNGLPVWTRDGRRVIFMSDRAGGVLNLYSQAADGTGAAERISAGSTPEWPTSITRDGKHLFGFTVRPTTLSDVVRFALAGDDKHAGTASSPNAGLSRAEFLLESRSGESFAEISPDGRYLAYQSDESGRNEVYVRPYPIVDDRSWRISTDGGTRAAWARDGSELFYIDASGALTSVAVQTSGPTFVAGKPVVVFDTKYGQPNPARHYDVSADGSRFLMLKESAAGDPNAAPASMVVVERWFDDLRQRVPPRRTVSRR